MQGSFNNFDFKIKELKVYKGDANSQFFKEVISEEAAYNERIQYLKGLINNTPIHQLTTRIPFLQGLPLSPFPRMQRCMGVTPYNGKMEILDRYVRIGFDLKVGHADETCLFDIYETEQDKFARW